MRGPGSSRDSESTSRMTFNGNGSPSKRDVSDSEQLELEHCQGNLKLAAGPLQLGKPEGHRGRSGGPSLAAMAAFPGTLSARKTASKSESVAPSEAQDQWCQCRRRATLPPTAAVTRQLSSTVTEPERHSGLRLSAALACPSLERSESAKLGVPESDSATQVHPAPVRRHGPSPARPGRCGRG